MTTQEDLIYPEIRISRFEPFQDKLGVWKPGVESQPDELYKQLFNFKEGYYAQLITGLRKLNNKKERDKYKQEKLPAFTFSAFIKGARNSKNVENHTSVLVIDIDNEGVIAYLKKRQQSNPDYNLGTLRNELCQPNDKGVTNIIFAGISASGTGMFLMFLIKPEDHLMAFKSIEWELENNFGIKVDPSCKDITRLRFCTYDPDAIINPMSQVVPYDPPTEFIEWQEIQEQRKQSLKSKPITFKSHSEAATAIINTAIKMIEKADVGQRHSSVLRAARLLGGYVATGVLSLEFAKEVLQAAVDARPDSDDEPTDRQKAIDWGLEQGQLSPIHLHVISPDDPQFEHFATSNDEQQERFKDFYKAILEHNRAGIAFSQIDFDALCMTFSIDPDRAHAIATRLYRTNTDEHNFDHLSKPHKLEIFVRKRWEIRRNVVTNDLFLRTRKSGNPWKLLKIEELWITCCKQGFQPSFEDLSRLMHTEMVELYNPFEDYFKAVHAKYNKSIDHIKELASCIKVSNTSDEFFEIMLKKMLVRAVKCAMENSYVNRYVFVFSSNMQNTGKTWFFRWLSPWGMDHYYAENPLYDTKDDRIRMSEVFIYNLEELSTITRKDVNTLKAIISAGSSKERRPYERNAETIPRRCSFFGSTNRTDFLTDDINTRWLVFEVNQIEWRYRTEVSNPGVWAQAYDLYVKGWDCELNSEESTMRDLINEKFSEITSENELLMRYFRPCEIAHRNAKLMTTTDIATKLFELSQNPRINLTLPSVGKALRKNKFLPYWHGPIKAFAVIPLNQNPDACPDARTFTAETRPGTFDEYPDLDPPF